MNIHDEDKTIILSCSLPCSYDQFVTTLTYRKNIISLNVITTRFLSLFQRRQSVKEGTQGDDMYLINGRDRGRNKGNEGSRKKMSKSIN